MRARAFAAAALAAAAVGCSTMPPAMPGHLDVRDQVVFYEVSGDTAGQILDDLQRQARESGRRYFAETRWNIDLSYRWDRASDGCRLSSSNVFVLVTRIMPRWTPSPKAAPGLTEQWRAFDAAGQVHEKGHRDIGVAAGKEVLESLRHLRTDSCDAFKPTAEAAIKRIIDRHNALNERYDEETRHGERQGAFWLVRQPR